MEGFHRYISAVVNEEIKTGELVKLAVQRHLNDLENLEGYYFDEKEAQRIINFSEKLNLWKGEWRGRPVKLEDHQRFYLGCMFGWKKLDGTRRFRRSYKEVARKNGKTTESAIKALYHLFLDGENGAQLLVGATKEEQAMICTHDIGMIAEATPWIRKRVKLIKYRDIVKRVIYGTSFAAAIGSDSKRQDGYDVSFGIIDEFHEHPTDKTVNILESGTGARRQPMIDIITTAGFNAHGPCASLRKVCVDILKGIKKDEEQFALIFCMDEEDDWQDPENWVKSNPNLGVSVKPEFLPGRFIQAMNEGGTKEVDFKTKNLNMWTNSAATWIKDEEWRACGSDDFPDLTGKICYGALDVGPVRDATAYSLYFPDQYVGHVLTWYFMPEDNVEDRVKEGFSYDKWIQNGYMITTPGNVTDHAYVFDFILKLHEKYDIQSSAYDRAFSIGIILPLVEGGAIMNPYGQGFVSMSTPTKALERMVISNKKEVKIVHDNNPVTRWMISNIAIKKDPAGNIKIDKDKSIEKVDGPVSIVMALGEYLNVDVQEEAPTIEAW